MKTYAESVEFADNVHKLAKAFVAAILETDCDNPADLLEAIRAKNQTAGYLGTMCCASHDYLDANMAMDRAFELTFCRGAWTGIDQDEGNCTEADNQADADLWNAAWNFARSTGMI